MVLSNEEREQLETLGKLRWDEAKIAAFFGWDKKMLHHELEDSESEISRLLLKGELQADFEIEAKMYDSATHGDLASAKHFAEIVRDRGFKMAKLDLFGGSESEETFKNIQRYVEDGCPGELSTKEQVYIDILHMVYSMNLKFGDRKTIKLLTRPPYNASYDRAKDLMCEAIELLAGGRRNSKEALRHHIAESYDALYHLTLEVAKTPQDMALASGILDKKAKVLQLDKPDDDILPPEQYRRSYRLSNLTPEILGLPEANRDELARQIDALDVPDSERERLRMEAGIVDMDVAKILYAQKEG